jgi:hypothetical protein
MAISPYLKGLRDQVGGDLLLLPSVAVMAFDGEGRLLLVRATDTGRWQTVGGAIDPGETPAEAALREAGRGDRTGGGAGPGDRLLRRPAVPVRLPERPPVRVRRDRLRGPAPRRARSGPTARRRARSGGSRPRTRRGSTWQRTRGSWSRRRSGGTRGRGSRRRAGAGRSDDPEPAEPHVRERRRGA